MAHDPVKVDPAHYRVEFENAHVRVLRIRYGPRERSVMHGHPPSVGVHLTDAHARFTFPGGKTEELRVKAGEVRSYPAGEHLPENLADQPLELVFMELKPRPAANKPTPGSSSEEAGGQEGNRAQVTIGGVAANDRMEESHDVDVWLSGETGRVPGSDRSRRKHIPI